MTGNRTISSQLLRFGVFELNTRTGELHKHGLRVKLNGQSISLLMALVEAGGEVVTREELRQRLWPGGVHVDFDHSLASAVNRIRAVLGDSVDTPRFIETLPKRGYRFLMPVIIIPQEPPSPAEKPAEQRRPPYRRQVIAKGAALAMLALLLALSKYGIHAWTQPSTHPLLATAIQPFSDATARKDRLSLCERLTRDITTELGVAPELRLVPSSGKPHALIGGDVRSTGDRLRITVRLFNAADGRVVWSDTYDRPGGISPPDVGPAIARAVRRQLALRRDKLFRARAINPEAYSLYQRARYGARLTADSIPYFQQAIVKDPHFALAEAGLAAAYVELAYQAEGSPRELLPKARQAAARALAIDDDLAEGHLELGIAKAAYEWDWAGAEREFRRALELNPNVDGGRPTYGIHLAVMGRFDEAMDQIIDNEPFPIGPATTYAAIFYLSRQYRRAIEYCRWILEFAPAADGIQFWLGRAYADQGRIGEALELLERSRGTDKQRGKGFGILASLYVRAGRRADAVKLQADTMKLAESRYVSPVSIAMIHIGLQDFDGAFQWLDRACDDRDLSVASLKVEPAYDPLRGDPRFHVLLHRLHLD